MTTLLLLSTFIALLAVQVPLTAVCLRIAAKRWSVDGMAWRKCLVAAIGLLAVGVFANLARMAVAIGGDDADVLSIVVALITAGGLSAFIIARLLKASFPKALLAWLATLLFSLPVFAVVALVVKPYMVESYSTPTNAMAPAILDDHLAGVCPECGAAAYASPSPSRSIADDDANDVLMICSRELRARNVHNPSPIVAAGDRFFVNKMLTARRWDLVVFRYPAEPSTIYVKRLVGMPGETVEIRDGAIWINGNQQTPPEPVSGLHYESEIRGMPPAWGSHERPAMLGFDEYYVLGDFSECSFDSRLWPQGAPGHPPYAVPASHMIGVVTRIYWPPSRWRVFR
jgi:signal peptidase I